MKVKPMLEALTKAKSEADLILVRANQDVYDALDALMENKDPDMQSKLVFKYNNALEMQRKAQTIWQHLADAINESIEADMYFIKLKQGIQK